MSKAPWYPRDAGCSVVGGGEPTFNYIPISSNTSPQFSSIFLHFHRPCSIFLVLVFFRSGSIERPIFWANGFLAAKKSRSDVRWIKNICIIWRQDEYGIMFVWRRRWWSLPQSWVSGLQQDLPNPTLIVPARPPPPNPDRREGENSFHHLPWIDEPSPFQPIKVQHPAFSPKHIRLRLGMDCVGMGKLSQSCQMIHTRLAKGAQQWGKEQDPIFRSKSRRRRRKISKTQVRPLSKQADLIGGKNKLGIGQVWW